jgi:hypothetical protein
MNARNILGIIIASSAAAGCGTEELFQLQLANNEAVLDNDAVASIVSDKYLFEQVVVVGDLDGDGIDDAMVEPSFVINDNPNDNPNDGPIPQGVVYVLYGGPPVAGKLTLEQLPSLTDIGSGQAHNVFPVVVPVGDVDGDGLADVLIRNACSGASDDQTHNGAYLLYGSTTRLSGATRAIDDAPFLRDLRPCAPAGAEGKLGDLDGDGKADFAMFLAPVYVYGEPAPSHAYLFYGRSTRLSGTVDIVAAADADLVFPHPGDNRLLGVGDVDGDGHADLFAATAPQQGPDIGNVVDLRLIHGTAQRMAGTLALADLPQSRFVDDTIGYDRTFSYTSPVAALRDLDGDGIDDFAVFGAPSSTGETPVRPSTQRVFYGRRGGFPAEVAVTDADATLIASDTELNASTPVATGDIDGDGILDLVMSDAARHDQDGAVYVLRGNGTRLSGDIDAATAGRTSVGSRRRLTGCEVRVGGFDCVGHERVGTYLSVGDLTGDGRPDVLVSAPWYNFIDSVAFGNFGPLSHAYIVSPRVATRP